MKKLFLNYLWGGTLGFMTLITFIEIIIHVPLYLYFYPKSTIIHSLFWSIWFIILIILQIYYKKRELNIGDKIHYTEGNLIENGKIKSFDEYGNPFVVYYCNNDWNNWKDYTGQHTPLNKIRKGWHTKK